jgi:hypothetical protein
VTTIKQARENARVRKEGIFEVFPVSPDGVGPAEYIRRQKEKAKKAGPKDKDDTSKRRKSLDENIDRMSSLRGRQTTDKGNS